MDMLNLMKKAASVQRELEKTQKALADRTVEFSSGGGMVKATATGGGTIKAIKIDPGVIDPAEAEMLEDMVLAAVDGALKEARKLADSEMSKITSGLGLPGLPGMGGGR